MNALAVAGVELRLFLRDRSNLFFVFVFPLLLVLMIGLQFGEGARVGRVAVSGPESSSALHSALVERLEHDDVVVSDPAWPDALDLLARGRLDVAVRVDGAAATAYDEGAAVTLEVVRGQSGNAQVVEQDVRVAVEAVRSDRNRIRTLTARGVRDAGAALAAAEDEVVAPRLEVHYADALSKEFEGLGQFDYGASGQLLLFVFLSCLAGSATLIQARRLGVVARMLAGPMTAGELVAGQILGRWAIGVFQGGYLIVATSLLFSVGWGNLALTFLVLLLFSLVASGAAILLGTLLNNEGAANGAGVGLGLVLAALGGSMLPLELFPDLIRRVADLTPHAWAYTAFAEVQRRGGTLVDVLPHLLVLAGMAVAVATLGAWALRRSLSRAM